MIVGDSVEVTCPWCGEPSTIDADGSEGNGEFAQDCPVCCRPWRVRLRVDPDGAAEASVEAEE